MLLDRCDMHVASFCKLLRWKLPNSRITSGLRHLPPPERCHDWGDICASFVCCARCVRHCVVSVLRESPPKKSLSLIVVISHFYLRPKFN